MKQLLLLGLLLLSATFAHATHLIGGSIGYEYVGKVGANYRYKIILTTYTNCGPDSNIPTPENNIQPVGVYGHDVQNNPQGGGNKSFITDVNMTLVSQLQIEPDFPSGCSISASSCIYKGVYEGTVDLPVNFNGYHLFYDRCCRNNSIVNLVIEQSMGFYAYIPPPLVPNSSPVFTNDPVPFLCAGDTSTLLNSAYDPDGDMLVFSFVEPYNGFGSATDPAPAPPATLGWTIPNVNYNAGYSHTQPFGNGGYSYIGASTGLTAYMPPSTGDYVVAIEIKEYRNGNLIGVTRRDLQLLVLNCPTNPAPNIDPALGSTNTQFSVEEGESICFDIGFNDPNGDSIILSATGAIFDPALISPAATITQPIYSIDTVSTEFCWTTGCGQGQALPYQFQVTAQDRGCTPKMTNVVYEITVNPVAPPDSISGPDQVCQYAEATYSIIEDPNSTYSWSIVGGNILSTTSNTATVEWTSQGTGIIRVKRTNQYGCESVEIEKNVTVLVAPDVDAGPDTLICLGDSIQFDATVTSNPGYTVAWDSDLFLNDSTLEDPIAFPNDTTIFYFSASLGQCTNTDSLTVAISFPLADAGNDTILCIGDSVQLGATTGTGTYAWMTSNTLSDTSILNPWAIPDSTTSYFLSHTNNQSCVIVDTVTVTVDTGFNLVVTPDTAICLNECVTLNVSGGGNFAWTPSNSLDDTTSTTPIACPTATTTYTVYSSTLACSDSADVEVTVNPLPIIDAGANVQICIGDSVQLGASGGVNYIWSPADSIDNINIANPTVWPTDTTWYYLTGTDANLCSSPDSVLVIVNPLPNVSAGNDVSICLGDSTQLSTSGADSYAWTPNTSISDTTISNPLSTTTSDIIYTVIGTDTNGCIFQDDVEITVNALPTITTTGDTSICFGDSVEVFATGGDTYAWAPSDSLSSTTNDTIIAYPTSTTDYTVVVTDGNNCVDSVTIEVEVYTLPSVSAGNDEDICSSDSVQLNASGAVNYTWAPADSIDNITISNPNVWPSDTTSYIVTGEDAQGCIQTDTVMVNVLPDAEADAGEDLWVCPGDDIQLTGSGGATYLWTPGASLDDPTSATPISTPTDTTQYILQVTTADGCVDTDTMFVFVNQSVPTDAGVDTTICRNDSVMIGGTPTAPTGSNYLWSPAAFVDDASSANPMAFPDSSMWFYVATNNDTCSGLDSVFITVNQLPNIDAGLDIQICIGDTASLSASGGDTYVWNNSTLLADDSAATTDAWPSDTTTFNVTGTDVNGCVNVDSMTVVVNPLPQAYAGLDTAICLFDTAQLMASGGVDYNWSPVDSLSATNVANPTASPTESTEYIVTVTDSNACVYSDSVMVTIYQLPVVSAGQNVAICINDSVQLNATGAEDYVWTPSTGLSNDSIADPYASPTSLQEYIVFGTDTNTCIQSDTVYVTVNGLPNVDAGSDLEMCINDTIQLSVTGASTYIWTPDSDLSDNTSDTPNSWAASTTTYFVQGTDANNCVNSDTIILTVHALPTADAGNDQDICLGNSAQLNATGGDDYLWTPSSTLDDHEISGPSATPDTTTTYIVQVTDSNTCINYDTVVVNVFRVSTIPDTSICSGDSVQLDVFGSPGTQFSWSPITALSDATVADPWASPTSTTTYTITVADVAGCQDQDDVTITVLANPTLVYTYTPDTTCDGIEMTFTNMSTDADSYSWNFGNGDTSSLMDPVVVFPYDGSYQITLNANNNSGCSSSTIETLNIGAFDDHFDIVIPNVFTPNNDYQNDLYKITIPGSIASCADFKVYNRWGQMIFKSFGNMITWDGRDADGKEVPTGTYFYTIVIKHHEYQGTINIFK